MTLLGSHRLHLCSHWGVWWWMATTNPVCEGVPGIRLGPRLVLFTYVIHWMQKSRQVVHWFCDVWNSFTTSIPNLSAIMSSSEPPQSVSNPSPSSPSSPIAGPSSTASTSAAAAAAAPRPPPPPLTGFRASLEHTGIPRSVLLWKPRLPSRNWSIFLSIVGSVTYAYYYDRKQCRKIRQEYIDKVKGKALEPMQGSLDVPRKVRVIAARWPEDDDENRGWLYFRKYLKVTISHPPLSTLNVQTGS